jgi:hypothetical protein
MSKNLFPSPFFSFIFLFFYFFFAFHSFITSLFFLYEGKRTHKEKEAMMQIALFFFLYFMHLSHHCLSRKCLGSFLYEGKKSKKEIEANEMLFFFFFFMKEK